MRWRDKRLVFFVKQKTAYELRISDWSSDVCSSDLIRLYWAAPGEHSRGWILMEIDQGNFARSKFLIRGGPVSTTEWRKPFSSLGVEFLPGHGQIGRASCRERVCQYV